MLDIHTTEAVNNSIVAETTYNNGNFSVTYNSISTSERLIIAHGVTNFRICSCKYLISLVFSA